MVRVGIIGGAGYTAGELLRILVNHPEAEIVFVHSTSNAGNYLYEVHGGLLGDTELRFSESYDLTAVDVLFLCSAHGRSREFWAENARPAGLKVVDLAQDFRDESEGYVYGLPEWQRERIRTADLVANPGCFATAIQLALLPLARAGLLHSPVHVTAVTGSTGAGVKPSATTHFSWRSDNLSTYKVFEHENPKFSEKEQQFSQKVDNFIKSKTGKSISAFPQYIFLVNKILMLTTFLEFLFQRFDIVTLFLNIVIILIEIGIFSHKHIYKWLMVLLTSILLDAFVLLDISPVSKNYLMKIL